MIGTVVKHKQKIHQGPISWSQLDALGYHALRCICIASYSYSQIDHRDNLLQHNLNFWPKKERELVE